MFRALTASPLALSYWSVPLSQSAIHELFLAAPDIDVTLAALKAFPPLVKEEKSIKPKFAKDFGEKLLRSSMMPNKTFESTKESEAFNVSVRPLFTVKQTESTYNGVVPSSPHINVPFPTQERMVPTDIGNRTGSVLDSSNARPTGPSLSSFSTTVSPGFEIIGEKKSDTQVLGSGDPLSFASLSLMFCVSCAHFISFSHASCLATMRVCSSDTVKAHSCFA